MPGIGGPELARRIVDRHPDIRVLYTSGYTDGAIVHHGVLAPDVVLLAKPFTIDRLLSRVREMLDGRRS